MRYFTRLIDKPLQEWANNPTPKPVLLRGARQVGKSWAIRHLGESFINFVEINFEKNPEYKTVFKENLDVNRITQQLSILTNKPIIDGETLLFFDEIQECQEAIMSLRFFWEDRRALHVIAAGSLLEFTLSELPTYGVGRIHSMFMYPMSFDEFLSAIGEHRLIEVRDNASTEHPLPEVIHNKIVELFRIFLLVGGMPEVVAKWVETHDYIKCQEIQNDLIVSYEDDFAKYRTKTTPDLLRNVLKSAPLQLTKKFVYSDVPGNYTTYEVKNALQLLFNSGLLIPVNRTAANGLPLGGEVNKGMVKILILDSGLALGLLGMGDSDVTGITRQILTEKASDLVNKGSMAELVAGLEMLKYQSSNIRHELYYWAREEKNSLAEIDYVIGDKGHVLPIEVKAGTRGGMKSLWIFMRTKKLFQAVRCSLENFGEFEYKDPYDDDIVRNVRILPLYAISKLFR